MKWYQAHLRVMSRLFELGLFDEVNACYRKYCFEGTDSDRDRFMSLVLENKDIKLYCDALKAKILLKKDLDYSDILFYYYKAIACFTMVKALQNVFGSKLNAIYDSDEMPARPYNVLFEKNGVIKDEVLINAFESQDFTISPKVFLGKLLCFNYDRYLFCNNHRLTSLRTSCYYNNNRIVTSDAAQKALSKTYNHVFRVLEVNKELQAVDNKQDSTTKEVNYFNIDSKLDSGFELLKAIDLLGMHLLLVAQRRHYMFERLGCDDLRSNYKALEKVNGSDIVLLHDNALKACFAFEEARKGLNNNNNNNASSLDDFNSLVKDYVGRNDALYQYICYFCQLFDDLDANDICTNIANSWEVEYYYFNLYEPFNKISWLQAKLLLGVKNFLSFDPNLGKDLKSAIYYEQDMVDRLVGSIPPSIFDICAHFAPSFSNASLSHPSFVNFAEIVHAVMSYSQSLNHVTLTLPYPIKKGSQYDEWDCGEIKWFKRKSKDSNDTIENINISLAYEVIKDHKPIVFSRKLNVYLDMFCLISNVVESYNNYYFRTICTSTSELMPESKLRFAFDLSYCSEDLVNTLYPTYELLLKDETFQALIECHQACFEHLVVILDLQGEIHLLYEDDYMSHLLHHTNNYDQELADSLALNKSARGTQDRPNLSKAEQLLLHKTCISYLQDCQKLCQISRELLEKTTEVDKLLNEKIENFMSAKNKVLSITQSLCVNPIVALNQYIVSKLENVPEDLKLSVAAASNNELSNNEFSSELNQSFYKCVYETMLTFLAKNMNIFTKEIIPYTKFATKEDFAKSLNSVCVIFNRHGEFKATNYLVMLAYKRLLQSYNYDRFISKHMCFNPIFVNNALTWILNSYSMTIRYAVFNIVKYFVRMVLSFTRIKQVDDSQDYLNMIYNLVHKLAKFFSAIPAKIRNLNALVEQGKVVLCECFEYKSYLCEIIDLFSLFEGLCSKYKGTYVDLNNIHDACKISGFCALYRDLLENAPKVLKCIDVNYFKNLDDHPHNGDVPYFNVQDYDSINPEYMRQIRNLGGERLAKVQLSVVEHFFGTEIASLIKTEDIWFHGEERIEYVSYHWPCRRVPEKKLTKTNMRLINLVMEHMRLMDDEELHQVLNLDSQKLATQIVDSSVSVPASASNAKPKAKGSTKRQTTSTKSKAQKDATISTAKAIADKATDSAVETEAKPKPKATRANKASAAEATTKTNTSAKTSPELEVEVEAKADGAAKTTRSKVKKAELAKNAAEIKSKAKTTTKATTTKGRAKNLAATASTEAKADEAIEAAKDAQTKPKKQATRAKKTATAGATTTTTSRASSSTSAK